METGKRLLSKFLAVLDAGGRFLFLDTSHFSSLHKNNAKGRAAPSTFLSRFWELLKKAKGFIIDFH